MAAAETSTTKCVDLNIALSNWKAGDAKKAISELIANAVDAQFDLAGNYKFPDVNFVASSESSGSLVISNKGPLLEPAHFQMYTSSTKKKFHGKYGIGLKEAVAVLMREDLSVQITSGCMIYKFSIKKSELGVDLS